MNKNDSQDIYEMTPGLAHALSHLRAAATAVMAQALARLPPVHCQQIKSAVNAEQCELTLQIDLPSHAVRVLADGQGWLKPQVLFALELSKSEGTANAEAPH